MKKKNGKLDFIKKVSQKKKKNKPDWEKYQQNTYLTKDYYSKHTNRTLKIQGKKIKSPKRKFKQCAMADSC